MKLPYPVVSTTRTFQHGERYGKSVCMFKEKIVNMLVKRHEVVLLMTRAT